MVNIACAEEAIEQYQSHRPSSSWGGAEKHKGGGRKQKQQDTCEQRHHGLRNASDRGNIGNEATCCSVFTCSHHSSLSRRGGVEKHQGVVHDWRKEASRGLKRSEQCQTTACQGTEGALRTT